MNFSSYCSVFSLIILIHSAAILSSELTSINSEQDADAGDDAEEDEDNYNNKSVVFNEEETIFNRVFALQESADLDAEQTLDSLRRLSEIYKQIHKQQKDDNNYAQLEQEVDTLIRISNQSQQVDATSNAGNLYKINQLLLDSYKKHKQANVVAYIQTYNDILLIKWIQWFISLQLNNELSGQKQLAHDMQTFRSELQKYNNQFENYHPFYRRNSLVQASLVYMQLKEGAFPAQVLKGKKGAKESFDARFNRTVFSLCSQIQAKFEKMSKVFAELTNRRDLISLVDGQTLKWIINESICRDITHDRQVLSKETFDYLLTVQA